MARYNEETRNAVGRARAPKGVYLVGDTSEHSFSQLEIQARWIASRKHMSSTRARLVAELAFQVGRASP
jgi:hypothetical protein